jgi:hypothetical protein
MERGIMKWLEDEVLRNLLDFGKSLENLLVGSSGRSWGGLQIV